MDTIFPSHTSPKPCHETVGQMTTFGDDPRAFIRHYLLTLDAQLDNPAPELLRTDGTVWVKLEDVTAAYTNGVIRNRNRKGLARLAPISQEISQQAAWWWTPTAIYQVTPAKYNDADAFAAYVCPYKDNSVQAKFLGADANYMFTGDMDGCTFGIGVPNSSGDVRVAHSNQQTLATGDQWNPNFAPQRTAQTQDVTNAGAGQHVLQPAVYRDNPPKGAELKAVTIGLRIKGAWEFYYQHQQVDGSDYRNKWATIKLN